MSRPRDQYAFALGSFNPDRILQRPFFRNFKFPNATDDEILAGYDVTDLSTSKEMEDRLESLKAVYNAVQRYFLRIHSHIIMLETHFAVYRTAKIEDRAKLLILSYKSVERFLRDILLASITQWIVSGDEALDEQRRREFAARLKATRLAAGLKQSDIARVLHSTINRYSAYERGISEPNIPTLIRICKLIKADTNKLLDL